MTAVIVLAAALWIGTFSGPLPGTLWEWEVGYADGVVETFTSGEWRLSFVPRPYRAWHARTRLDGGAWSEWGDWVPADPFPGDANGDCVVGGADFLTLSGHWGQACP